MEFTAFICISVLLLSLTAWCSSLARAMNENKAPNTNPDHMIQGSTRCNHPVRETPDVNIELENQKAYEPVQLGLSLLDQGKELDDVPSIEAPEFFPDYLSLVNVDISDGLLLISEEQAATFAREIYLRRHKKIVPAGYVRSMRKHRTVQVFSAARPATKR